MKMNWKSLAIIAALLVGLAGTSGCSGDDAGGSATPSAIPSAAPTVTPIATPTPTPSIQPTVEPTPEPTQNPTDIVSTDKFLQDVEEAVDGAIGSESIIEAKLETENLIISIDLSGAKVPEGFTLEDIAESRASSITDSILELKEYDDLWESITIDFGNIGKVKAHKSDIQVEDYGRFFPSESLKLQK